MSKDESSGDALREVAEARARLAEAKLEAVRQVLQDWDFCNEAQETALLDALEPLVDLAGRER